MAKGGGEISHLNKHPERSGSLENDHPGYFIIFALMDDPPVYLQTSNLVIHVVAS